MVERQRDVNDFGRLLAGHLQRVGLSQSQFAQQAGILQQTLNKLCHQGALKEPRPVEVVQRWGEILGLSPAQVAELHFELALVRCPAVVKKAIADLRLAPVTKVKRRRTDS